MTLTDLDAMERELSSLPPPAPAAPQPQPFVEPLSSEFSTASAFESTTPKAPSEIALSPFVVLHHESTHYGVLGGGFVFRGPSRIVVLDSDGRTALDSDVTFEIPGYIEVVGERGGTARPWRSQNVVPYGQLLPRLLEALKDKMLVVGNAAAALLELRLSARSANVVELCKDHEVRVFFSEENPHENASSLLENRQPLPLRRTAELFGEMWPEQLVEQARLLYRIFMRVRERVERAFLRVEQDPKSWNTISFLKPEWLHSYWKPAREFDLLESVRREREYKSEEERLRRGRSGQQTPSGSRSSSRGPAEPSPGQKRTLAQSGATRGAGSASSGARTPLPPPPPPRFAMTQFAALAEERARTVVHFGPIEHPDPQVLSTFRSLTEKNSGIWGVLLFYLRSEGVVSEREYTDVVMCSAANEEAMVFVCLSAQRDRAARVLEKIVRMREQDLVTALAKLEEDVLQYTIMRLSRISRRWRRWRSSGLPNLRPAGARRWDRVAPPHLLRVSPVCVRSRLSRAPRGCPL